MVFFLAFTTKTAYCIYQVAKEDRSIVDEVVLLGLWVPWHVVPSTFVFFTHHMAYKNMVDRDLDELKQSTMTIPQEFLTAADRFAHDESR